MEQILTDLTLGDAPLTPEERKRIEFEKEVDLAIKNHRPDRTPNLYLMRNSERYRYHVWETGAIYDNGAGRRYYRTNRGWKKNLKEFRPTPTGGFWTFDGEQKFWVDFVGLQMRFHRDPSTASIEEDGESNPTGHYRIWANVKILRTQVRRVGKRKIKEYIWEGKTKWTPLSYWFMSESEIRAAMAQIKETHKPLVHYRPGEVYTYCPDSLIETYHEREQVQEFYGQIVNYIPDHIENNRTRIFDTNELCELNGVEVVYGDIADKQYFLDYGPVRELW